MLNDPAQSARIAAAFVLAAPFVLIGLVIAIRSPFWACRSLSSLERREPVPRQRWLRQTAIGEIVAVGTIVFGAAIFLLMFLPLDVHTMARIELAVAILLATAGPIVTLRGTITRETFGIIAVRQWLAKVYAFEVIATFMGINAARNLLPAESRATGILLFLQIASGLLFLIELAHLAFANGFLGQRAIEESYNRHLARNGLDTASGPAAGPARLTRASARRPVRSGRKKGMA